MHAYVVSAGRRVRDLSAAAARFMLRPKGHIEPVTLGLLLAAGCVPLVLAFARVLAFPGADVPPTLQGLADLGRALNRSFSLHWVPPDDQASVVYLLSLPTGALLVAFARLTLGLRVLGLRAILLAIAFQEIGFVASFSLMVVVIGAIAAIRPTMRQMRLPLYARVPVILCVSATIMVGALLLGPWVQSETVFSVAFFPAIILAMMAEGIAKTLANDSAPVAAWRAFATIVLAIVLALIGQTRAVAALTLQFPELLLTELVAIVLIAEFLDLRLLEHWPAPLARFFGGARARPDPPRVAIVRNRSRSGAIGRLGVPAPRIYRKQSVQPIVAALRAQGFAVRVLEGDRLLARELQEFLAPNPRSGAPGGIVLNVATGLQGVGRFCHVPALLEMLGIAYTGPDPLTHARLADRYMLLSTLHHARLRVPRFALVMAPTNVAGRFRFPVSVRPRCEPDASSVVVRDDRELEAAVRAVVDRYDQDAFVEEVVEGLEVRAPLLGNDTVESFPLLEHVPQEKRERCPARISDEQSSAVRECAYKAYRALRCRDYARVDLRITATGELVVVDVHWANLLEPDGSFSRAAQRAGISFHELVGRVIEEASLRYSLPTRSPRGLARVRESRALSAPAERLLSARTTVEGSP